jgi:putative membrane-bound dehydrogenase-like protein
MCVLPRMKKKTSKISRAALGATVVFSGWVFLLGNAAEGQENSETVEVKADGFEVTVFAEPFDVEYPTALAPSPDGVVYVSSDPNSSLGKGRMGKVVACRDTDGDGRADAFQDFIPEVMGPRGGHMVGGRFYLIHPPYLSVYWDEDGDGVAEKSRQLVNGLGASAQESRGGDHTTNGVRMGIDGWLYISVGDFGMSSATGTDGREVTLHGGGVARVRPDGSGLEMYSYHTRNQCDVAISPYLDLFTRDNTNDGKGWNIRVHHFTNLSEHGYPRLYQNFEQEAVKPLLDLGGGSGTGALYLHEPGFPQDYGNKLLTCDWTTGNVFEHNLEPFEATFRAEQEVFMDLTRATDIDVDGESRLYTADWRGGAYNYEGDGAKVGRIHRVVPTGYTAEKWPDLATVEDGLLMRQLYHRSAVRRLEAQREILARGSWDDFAPLIEAALEGRRPLYGQVAAIFTLKQLGGEKADETLQALLERPSLREFALRALADRRSQSTSLSNEKLALLLADGNPRVQLQAAIAMERLGRKELAGELIQAAAKPFRADQKLEGQEDFRFPHTAVQVLKHLEATEAALAAVADPDTREIALAALKYLANPKAVAGLETILENAGSDRDLRREIMEVMARLVHREAKWDETSWWETRPDDRGPYFKPVRWEESGRLLAALERAYRKLSEDDQEGALEMFARNRLDITKMNLGKQDPVLLALEAAEPSPGQINLLVEAALDAGRKWSQRLAAYRAVARSQSEKTFEKQIAILAGWAEDDELADESEREIAEFINSPSLILKLEELYQFAEKARPEESEVAWKAIFTFAKSPLIEAEKRARALELAQQPSKSIGYFRALADLKIDGFEESVASALEADNRALIKAAQAAQTALAERKDLAPSDSGALVATLEPKAVYEEVMVSAGDSDAVAFGEKLFTQQACASCHAVSLDEVQKGPYLGSAGSKFQRDYLIESILEPEKTVAQGFRTVMFTMKDGTVHVGFITREEDGKVDVRNIGGVVTTLDADQIEKREEQENSMMPAGLASGLTVAELTALIDYLESLEED